MFWVSLPASIRRITGSVFFWRLGRDPGRSSQSRQVARGFVRSASEHLRGWKTAPPTSSPAFSPPQLSKPKGRSAPPGCLRSLPATPGGRGFPCPVLHGRRREEPLPSRQLSSRGGGRFAPSPAGAARGRGPLPPQEAPRRARSTGPRSAPPPCRPRRQARARRGGGGGGRAGRRGACGRGAAGRGPGPAAEVLRGCGGDAAAAPT